MNSGKYIVQLENIKLPSGSVRLQLPLSITEVSGRLLVSDFASRDDRDMSVARYNVVFSDSPHDIIEYSTTRTIGRGSYSVVYEIAPIFYTPHPIPFALKAYNRTDLEDGGMYIQLERQLASHPDLTGIMVPAMRIPGDIPYDDLLMSVCPGSLLSLFHVYDAPPQSARLAEQIAQHVFDMESALIKVGYIHTDINIANILYQVVGEQEIRLMFGDYGGLHKIGSSRMGCCTIGLPEYEYASYVSIRTDTDAINASYFLAACVGCAVFMYNRMGPLYNALCYAGAPMVTNRTTDFEALKNIMLEAGCFKILQWLNVDPSKRDSSSSTPLSPPVTASSVSSLFLSSSIKSPSKTAE